MEFDLGVRAYPPVQPGGYWRIRWEERRSRKDTTAKNRTAAIAKATEIVDRLARQIARTRTRHRWGDPENTERHVGVAFTASRRS